MFDARGADEAEPVTQFLLPRTDLAVLLQFSALIVLLAMGLWWTRHRPDGRLVVSGAGLLLLALLLLRAAH